MKLRYVPSKQEIGQTIKSARRRKGWSQDELARRVGASGRHTVITWEQGTHEPTDFRDKLAAELGLEVAALTLDVAPAELDALARRFRDWEAEGDRIRAALEAALLARGDGGFAPE